MAALCSSSSSSHRLSLPATAPAHVSPSRAAPPLSSSSPNCPTVSADSNQASSFWLGLFSKSSSTVATGLRHFKPVFCNGIPKVPRDVFNIGIARCSKFLVGSFIGKKMPYFLVKRELDKLLRCKDVVGLSSDKDRFFIEVKNPDHRRILLEGGPIFIAGRILLIREWSSELEAQDDPLLSVPLWINLEIPRELWSIEGIGFCASLFGLPLGMDEFTAKLSKTKFARVCVEVKNGFEFPESLPVDLDTRIDVIKAVYKWKPESCNQCLRFGHNSGNCSTVSERPGRNTSNAESLQQEPNHRRGREQLPTDRGQQWQDMHRPNQSVQVIDQSSKEKSTLQSSDLGEKDLDRGLQRAPIAFTGTSPEGPGTTFTNEKEIDVETPVANMFCVLENLSEEELEEGEILAAPESNQGASKMLNTEALIEQGSIGTNSEIRLEGDPTLHTLNSCLNLCEEVVASTIQATGSPLELPKVQRSVENDGTLVDKGGTKFFKVNRDPAKPESRIDAMREAERKISLVLDRINNPEELLMKLRRLT